MTETIAPSNFVKEAIEEDLRNGRFNHVQTRFPPEPNGYLHIGHTKAFIIDFGMAEAFGGVCNLRYDDTNPVKEDTEFVDAIKEDIQWLGFQWGQELYASDYFDVLYDMSVKLIKKGLAYVDDLSQEEIRAYRGTLTEPGKESPYRSRPVEENLDLFERMKNGEFPEGSRVLRAKIDMVSGNINMRDPVMYRILKATHHRTGDKWCIYPMYDFAHGQSDSIEGVTHSLCDTGYEDHRPLYEWFLDALELPNKPRQIEFARLNLTYTVVSKRYLKQLVTNGLVRGWNDPRMPTLSGMRRRGYPAQAIRDFIDRVGVAKNEAVADVALLEHCVREVLNKNASRVMAVLDPLKVVIDNYPEGQVEELDAVNNPENPEAGSRKVPFSKVLYIEKDDFREVAPPKFFRLAPGKEVRLRYGYFIRCMDVVKNEAGEVVELHCTYDPETRGGYAPDGRKVQGTLHWVSADHALNAEVRLYDRLFSRIEPLNVAEGETFMDSLNPNSMRVIEKAKVEPSLANALVGQTYQFERLGYFAADPDTQPGALVFNRTVELRDTWSKIEGKK